MSKKVKAMMLAAVAVMSLGAVAMAAPITADQAKDIALEKVPGATQAHVLKFKSDIEDGRHVYEGEIYYQGVEYEFDIDANSGQVLKWEEEHYGHQGHQEKQGHRVHNKR